VVAARDDPPSGGAAPAPAAAAADPARALAAGPDRQSHWKTAAGVALTAPALGALAVTLLYPIGWTLWLSLNGARTALQGRPDFVGLRNYLKIALNPDFQTALLQTLGLTAASFVLEAILALAVALALDRGLKGARLIRAVIALPLMVAPVVGALAWRFMFATGYGLIDSFLHLIGASGPLWFANLWLARVTIVVANLWLALPFDILVLLAGLAGLPQEPFEAARVDGASPIQIFTRITLPLLRPVIAVILVIRIADAFRVFDVVYVLTGGGPANKTDVLSTFIYRQMFSAFDFAGGAAASILLVVITSLASLVVVVGLSEREGEA